MREGSSGSLESTKDWVNSRCWVFFNQSNKSNLQIWSAFLFWWGAKASNDKEKYLSKIHQQYQQTGSQTKNSKETWEGDKGLAPGEFLLINYYPFYFIFIF